MISIILIAGSSMTHSAWAANRLLIGDLPFATSSDEVNRLASGFGSVLSVKVKSTDNNGDLSTYAVVKFATEEGVDRAAAALDGFVYLGSPLIVRAKKAKEIVVVGSKVKDIVRSAGLRSDGDLVQAVSDQVHKILEAAIYRAGKNKRGTVRPYDL